SLAQCNRSPSLLDFFPCHGAHLIGFHRQAVLQFTIAKDFYSGEMASDKIRLAWHLFVYHDSGFKCIEVVDIDNRAMLVKRRIIESPLRQPSNQRHLPTFEPKPNAPARAGLLPFMPFAAGFPVP